MESPNAPSRIPCAASAFICSISSAVAFRFASPITVSRMLPWPTMVPKFTEIRIFAIPSRKLEMGSGELPSGPSMMVVTPSRR